MLLVQCFESSYDFPEEHMDYLRRAMQLVEEKRGDWKRHGAAVFRHGVLAAFFDGLPEIDQWIAKAEELFPDSMPAAFAEARRIFARSGTMRLVSSTLET